MPPRGGHEPGVLDHFALGSPPVFPWGRPSVWALTWPLGVRHLFIFKGLGNKSRCLYQSKRRRSWVRVPFVPVKMEVCPVRWKEQVTLSVPRYPSKTLLAELHPTGPSALPWAVGMRQRVSQLLERQCYTLHLLNTYSHIWLPPKLVL